MTSDWLKGVVMTTPESKGTTPVKGSSSGRSKVAGRRVSFVRYVGDERTLYHLCHLYYIYTCIPFNMISFYATMERCCIFRLQRPAKAACQTDANFIVVTSWICYDHR